MSAPCPILGFIVTIALPDDGVAAVRDLVDVLEAHGLTARHGVGQVIELVVHREGSQATDADRAIVRDWAARWSGRATVTVGDLIDLA